MTNQSPATKQQNWERQQGYSCQASTSKIEESIWAEEELEWELDIILDENPNVNYDKLSEKLCTYAYTNNLDDMLFRDVYDVVNKIMSEVIRNE